MSEQPLDLRRALRIVWRRKLLVGAFVVLGLASGVVYTAHHPPMLSSTALVVLSPGTHDTRTQVVIASSDPVLARTARSVDTGMPVSTLHQRIEVKSLTYNVISITVQGKTAAQAERTANAVANSYIAYVGSGRTPGQVVHAQVLSPATDATGGSLAFRLLADGGLGALAGFLVGAVLALALSHSDRRLRMREEIADSIGVPVLASVLVRHPSRATDWRKLLEDYEPGPVDAWRLRSALQDLDLAEVNGSGPSLAVLSLSSDRKALAIGPQLAVFAASLGIPTTLVIGPQHDVSPIATLRAACLALAALSKPLRNLRVAVNDHDTSLQPDSGLTIVVTVVDGEAPKLAGTMQAAATVLGVSAGGATAEQLARVAACAAADGRHIAGILVADPDPADHTISRIPQLAGRTQRKMPMRLTGEPMETRR